MRDQQVVRNLSEETKWWGICVMGPGNLSEGTSRWWGIYVRGPAGGGVFE